LGAPTVAAFLTFMVWRDLMKASLVPALAAAIAVWVLMPRSSVRDEAEVTSVRAYFVSLIGLLKNRVLLLLLLTTGLRGIGERAAAGFLPLYLIDGLEYSVTKVAVILALAQISGIISQPAMGYLSDRYGRKAVLFPATALVILSAFALSVVRPGVQLFLVILVRGAFSFSLHHIFLAAALDAARGAAQSTVVSLVYGAGFFGVFSPYVAGVISDRYGIHSAFVFGGVVLIVPTVILALARLPAPSTALDGESEGVRTRDARS
jgi:predicted MFS family arabinose efflux permease